MSIMTRAAKLQLGCLMHWPGRYAESGTPKGFLILPSGVNAAVNGSFTVRKQKSGQNIYLFNGFGNYISVGANAAWNIGTSDMTLCFWVKKSTTASMTAFDLWTEIANDLFVNLGSATTRIANKQSGSYTHDTITAGVVGTALTFVSFVRTASLRQIRFNLINQTLTTDINGAIGSAARTPLIGYGPDNYSFTGNLSDMMVFNRALTLDQLGAIMDETFIY